MQKHNTRVATRNTRFWRFFENNFKKLKFHYGGRKRDLIDEISLLQERWKGDAKKGLFYMLSWKNFMLCTINFHFCERWKAYESFKSLIFLEISRNYHLRNYQLSPISSPLHYSNIL